MIIVNMKTIHSIKMDNEKNNSELALDFKQGLKELKEGKIIKC